MPEIYKAGDVIDITITGTQVVRVSGNFIFTECADLININDPKVSVRVVKQLPTKVGSQIRQGNAILTLNGYGNWVDEYNDPYSKQSILDSDFQVRKDEWE